MMVKEFLNYLRFERNYSEKTIKSYGDNLQEFESYFKSLDTHLSWESVDSDVIRDWMESMMDKGNIASSINTRLSALRSFFRFALSRNLVDSDPAHCVVGPKREKPLPQFLKDSEMQTLLDEKMWNLDKYEDVRARTILLIFYETGVRVAELAGLNDELVDLETCQLKVTGKRNRQRVIPFGTELRDAIKAYMAKRSESVAAQSHALMLTDKGLRMSTGQIRTVVQKQLSRVCTLKKRSPHILRHTFATTMLNHGAGIESVKKLLGHQKLATTEIYTHTTFEQLKKVYQSAHPRA